MKKTIAFFLVTLLALVEQALAQTQKPILTLVNPNPTQNGEFGDIVTTVGKNILVGAPGGSGAAYLFDGRNGKLLRTFLNPTPARGDRFGATVAAFGNNVLIGAPFDDEGGKDRGIVYLFDATTGNIIRSFPNPASGDSALFGYSIASAGNKILIGAPSYNFFAQKTRKGTVYQFDGVTGSLLRIFQNLNSAKAAEFGYSVAMSENRVIVGAPGDTLQGNRFDLGRIHIFDENSGQLLFILLRRGQRFCLDYRFGSSVVLFKNSILVGATGGIVVDEGGEATNGTASRFEIDTGNPLTCFSPSPFASIPPFQFGRSIAAIDDKIIVGSPFERMQTGAVHIFNDATGNLQQTFFPTLAGLGFGYSVAAVDEFVIVGAPFHINAGSTGVVYLFSTAPINCSLSITSPRNGAAICNSSVSVKTATRITGGVPPFTIQCEINGVRATVTDTTATATVPLSIGENTLVATCTVVDSSGNQAVCVDSIRVIGCDPNQSLRGATVSPFPIASGRFGSAVAALGNNILAGAPGDDVKGIRAGAVYLIDAANENILRTLSDPVPTVGDSFGFSIAVAGNNILIGAPFFDNKDDDSGNITATDVGRAFLFDGNTGALLQIFRNPSPTANDQFGYSVALLGSNVVIGAPRDDAGGTDAGSVYLFNAITGQLFLTIPNPEPGSSDFFGSSLAVVGNNLIVGTPSDGDAQVADAGSAYVFDISTGQLLRTLQNQPRIGGAGLGSALAAFGNNVLVGAPFGTGGVYLFDISTGNIIRNFLNPTSTNDSFGSSISVVGNNVLIGAPGNDTGTTDAGTAYLFNGATGALVQTFTNPAPAVGDRFGSAVVGGADQAIIGAPFDDLGGPDAGAVYVFSAAQLTCALSFVSPKDGTAVCSDSISSQVRLDIEGGVAPFTIQYNVNGLNVSATTTDTVVIITKKVPLRPGSNTLVANAAITDSRNDQSVCVESVSMTRDSIARNLVLNEILADPNYDDLGAEKIELKNIGATPILLDSTLALWIRRGSSDTYWTFRKKRVTLAPNQFFVIHWLGRGPDDDGNVFTDLPTDGGGANTARDGFWGNNSETASNMTLGGVGNKEAFSIALVQNIVPGAATGFNNSCNLLDFVQICGRVPASESVAVEAGIWRPGVALDCPKEGLSENLDPNGDYDPFTPSIGEDPILLPNDHLLITEICVKPDNSEFVEIYNPMRTSIDLSDYYLTDNANGLNDPAYIRLVKGADSVQVQRDDFLVQFPAGAQIQPREFQTIALSGKNFIARYVLKPTYEIRDDDATVTNMIAIKTGAGGVELFSDALVLLKWAKSDSADLVKDVDYVVWDERAIILGPDSAPSKFTSDFQEQITLSAIDPPLQGVNKSGLGIDGVDRNNVRLYYNNEAAVANQIPIANTGHADLKSWQRKNFTEVGEKLVGGNGLAGHDEMSENLAAAFKEDKPTPGTSTKVGPLDGLTQKRIETFQTIVDRSAKDTRLIAKGFPNKLINPGEVVSVIILLQNNNDQPTGAFFGILRPLDSVVTMIDSTANFPSIAGRGASDSSRAPYVFKVDDVILPDSLRFQLVMIQKSSNPPKLNKSGDVSELNAVTVRVIFIVLPTVNISFDIAYSLPLQATSKPGSNLMRFAYSLIFVPPDAGVPAGYNATEMRVAVKTQNLNDSLFAGVIPRDPQNFTLGNSVRMVKDFLLLNLGEKFKDSLPSSFDLTISWNEPCTNCGSYPGVPAGKRPIPGGVTITSAFLDSLIISGEIVYYANALDEDEQPVQQPIGKVNIFVKAPSATRFPLTTMIRTNGDGIFSFKVGKLDTGAYRIYAALATAVPANAIGSNDVTQATLLMGSPQFPMKNDQVFKRLAADAHRDGIINNCDLNAISNPTVPLGCDQTKVRRGLWTFVDAAITSVTNGTFSSAKDTLEFRVRNYGRQGNFVGIVYGDADGYLGQFFPTPCAAAGSTPNRNLTSVQRSGQDVPREFFLSQNYPNPFNPMTRIEYGLPRNERVLLQIFNVVGQLVYTGVDQSQPAGYYEIDWDGRNQDGKPAPAGIYLMRLQAGTYSQVRKLALVK